MKSLNLLSITYLFLSLFVFGSKSAIINHIGGQAGI